MKNNRRYSYVGADMVKTFKNFKQMQEFAKDEAHNGMYYISCTDVTFKKTRETILRTKENR